MSRQARWPATDAEFVRRHLQECIVSEYSLDELTRIFQKLGAPDPEGWARSQIQEGIPQLARYPTDASRGVCQSVCIGRVELGNNAIL